VKDRLAVCISLRQKVTHIEIFAVQFINDVVVAEPLKKICRPWFPGRGLSRDCKMQHISVFGASAPIGIHFTLVHLLITSLLKWVVCVCVCVCVCVVCVCVCAHAGTMMMMCVLCVCARARPRVPPTPLRLCLRACIRGSSQSSQSIL
jgi:hypothetical protein